MGGPLELVRVLYKEDPTTIIIISSQPAIMNNTMSFITYICAVLVLVHVLVIPVCCNQSENTDSNEDIIVSKREPGLPARPPCWMARCTRRRRRAGVDKKRSQIKVREQRNISRRHILKEMLHFSGKVTRARAELQSPKAAFVLLKLSVTVSQTKT